MKKVKSTIKRVEKGMSLVEILVVIAVFGILGTITTSAVMMTLRGARKSESQQLVRENLNYAMSVVERQIRGAADITSCSSSTISYKAADNANSSFTCTSIGTNGYIASGSARLTSDEISLTSCSFTCTQTDLNQPPRVLISVAGRTRNTTGVETTSITVQTEITLRNYSN